MKKTSILLAFLAMLFVHVSHAQKQNGSVNFKIPEDVIPVDWNKNGFRGILMLRKDSPSGMFIGYPNDGEKIADLKERAAKFVAPMVIKDDNGGDDFGLQKTLIPKREGDSADALYYSYSNKKSTAQVIIFERITNGKPFIYGYFAFRGNDEDPKKVKNWADDKGHGVKLFEKFWKSIKE